MMETKPTFPGGWSTWRSIETSWELSCPSDRHNNLFTNFPLIGGCSTTARLVSLLKIFFQDVICFSTKPPYAINNRLFTTRRRMSWSKKPTSLNPQHDISSVALVLDLLGAKWARCLATLRWARRFKSLLRLPSRRMKIKPFTSWIFSHLHWLASYPFSSYNPCKILNKKSRDTADICFFLCVSLWQTFSPFLSWCHFFLLGKTGKKKRKRKKKTEWKGEFWLSILPRKKGESIPIRLKEPRNFLEKNKNTKSGSTQSNGVGDQTNTRGNRGSKKGKGEKRDIFPKVHPANWHYKYDDLSLHLCMQPNQAKEHQSLHKTFTRPSQDLHKNLHKNLHTPPLNHP